MSQESTHRKHAAFQASVEKSEKVLCIHIDFVSDSKPLVFFEGTDVLEL